MRNLGVKEGGVGFSIDEHNRKLITADMEKRLEQARADIIAGKIKVTDYMAKLAKRTPGGKSSGGGRWMSSFMPSGASAHPGSPRAAPHGST